MRKFIISAVLGIVFASANPVLAQGSVAPNTEVPADEKMAEISAMLSNIFQAESLTPEQAARLPQARTVVGQMMPEGFYGEMMRGMMDKMIRPMMSMFTQPDFILGSRLEIDEEVISALDEEQKVELLTMLDPAYDRRVDAIVKVVTDSMGGMYQALEPPMRDGLSKAYAVRFDERQLDDIATFFATPTGTVYAKESMALFADPQVMQATMQALPAMLGSFGNMETTMAAAMAELPAERGFEDLSPAERTRMADLLATDPASLRDIVNPPKSEDNQDSLSNM